MPLTKEELAKELGKPINLITDELVDYLNSLASDEPDKAELIMDNLYTYSFIMNNTSYSVQQYVNAVKFASCVLMHMTNIDAYKFTYPDRYRRLELKYSHLSESERRDKMSPSVSAVANSKLVVTLLSQVQIPTKLLNLGVLQRAINVEVELMETARSEAVKEKAASTLIQYLGAEDQHSVELDVGVKQGAIVEEYERALLFLVGEQEKLIKKGGDVKTIANVSMKIQDAEIEESPTE